GGSGPLIPRASGFNGGMCLIALASLGALMQGIRLTACLNLLAKFGLSACMEYALWHSLLVFVWQLLCIVFCGYV
ncbi:MAG: hypothetical protein OSJ22_04955, partial [Rikenellaceae bacterium]|nr:hypothetical protein [Rikenellaceae bacterium]